MNQFIRLSMLSHSDRQAGQWGDTPKTTEHRASSGLVLPVTTPPPPSTSGSTWPAWGLGTSDLSLPGWLHSEIRRSWEKLRNKQMLVLSVFSETNIPIIIICVVLSTCSTYNLQTETS